MVLPCPVFGSLLHDSFMQWHSSLASRSPLQSYSCIAWLPLLSRHASYAYLACQASSANLVHAYVGTLAGMLLSSVPCLCRPGGACVPVLFTLQPRHARVRSHAPAYPGALCVHGTPFQSPNAGKLILGGLATRGRTLLIRGRSSAYHRHTEAMGAQPHGNRAPWSQDPLRRRRPRVCGHAHEPVPAGPTIRSPAGRV